MREGGKGIRKKFAKFRLQPLGEVKKKRFANPVFIDPVRYTCTLIEKLPTFDNFLDIR